jgi:hypothetical protein
LANKLAENFDIKPDHKADSPAAPTLSGADALTREFLNTNGSAKSDLSVGTRVAALAESAAVGTVTHGLDQIVNHPLEVGSQVLGAAALGLALRGPAWTRLPAMAVAFVGTISYGKTLLDTGSETARTFGLMNSHNLAKSKEHLEATLGPVLFDTSLMSAAGIGAGKLADHLPSQAPKAQIMASLDLAKDVATSHVQNLLKVGENAMTPAFAGAGPMPGALNSGSHESLSEGLKSIWSKPQESQIMAMSALDGSAGGSGRTQVGGDGIAFRTARGLNGENLYMIDHVPPGRTVNVTDANGAVTSLGSDGKIMVGFTTGEGRQLDLGQAIRRVVMTEHAHGLKQFTFNDRLVADLEVAHDKHAVRAVLPNGDHLHMMDNVQGGFTHFAHNDGLQTWIENSGRVVVQVPNARQHEVQIPEKIGYIRMVEKTDGGKEFRFLNNAGTPIAQKIELPPTPQLQAIKTPDEARNWHDLRNYLASRAIAQQTLHQDVASQGGGGVYRVEPSAGGTINYHNHNNGPSHAARMMRVQPSYERAVAHEIGVPYNIMRGNDLSAPADMELAMQNHGWLVTSYLDRLDHQDSVFDHHGGY